RLSRQRKAGSLGDRGPAGGNDRLPDEALVYLLGSRYCDTEKLSDLAWSLFGSIQADGSEFRLFAIMSMTESCSVTITRPYSGGRLPGADWRMQGFRPSRGYVLPRHQHPRTLLHRRARRYWSASRSGSHGF